MEVKELGNNCVRDIKVFRKLTKNRTWYLLMEVEWNIDNSYFNETFFCFKSMYGSNMLFERYKSYYDEKYNSCRELKNRRASVNVHNDREVNVEIDFYFTDANYILSIDCGLNPYWDETQSSPKWILKSESDRVDDAIDGLIEESERC